MCPNVCVGSLVLDRPVPANFHAHVGEVVSFVPVGVASVYTHRIVQVLPNGSFKTKGDAANIIDPWTVSRTDVRGVTVGTIWGLGWLSEALPFMALGMVVIMLVRRLIPVSVRREWDRLFAVLTVLVPVWLLKPLIRGILVSSTPIGHGVDKVAIVNTGLLPSQFRITQGQFRDFVSSGHRVIMTGHAQKNGQVSVSEFASFHWLGWTIVALLSLSPLIGYCYRYLRLRRLGLLGVEVPSEFRSDISAWHVGHEE
jgi:hypothetical protein